MPVLATVFVALQAGYTLPLGLLKAQQNTPLLWIVDTLPLITLFYTRFLAQPVQGNRSAPLLISILLLLFLIPCSAMLRAWQESTENLSHLQNIQRAGQLRALATTLYLQKSKTGNSSKKELAAMGGLRKEIKASAPSALRLTETSWNRFYQEALTSGPSRETTDQLQKSIDRFTKSLQSDASSNHGETAQLLLGGLVATLTAMLLSLQLFAQLRQAEHKLVEGQKQQLRTNQQLETSNAKLEEANRRLSAINSQLEQSVAHDPLTGLYNRRALDERFQTEWNRAVRYREPLSVALLDVDYFKTYNDSFGHPAGDAVLETIGMILQHGLRVTDVATRYGGEEFLVILPQTSEEEATRIMERIRIAIQAAPWKHRTITISIGIAERSPKMIAPLDLIHSADVALYHAKKTRNRVSSAREVPAQGQITN